MIHGHLLLWPQNAGTFLQLLCPVPVASDASSTDTICYPHLFLLGYFLFSLTPRGCRVLCPFSIPASLGCASKLIVKEEVTTGCGHHTKKRCHLPESWGWSSLLCASSFPSPWRLLSAQGLGLKASLFPLPSRDLCPLTLQALLPRKDSHAHTASCPHTSPEG